MSAEDRLFEDEDPPSLGSFGAAGEEEDDYEVMLPPSVIPGKASVAIAEGAIAEEAGFNQKSEVFAEGVKMEFPSGGDERMLTQDDNAFSMFSRQPFEPNAEIDFFTGEQFFAEAANFTKRSGFAKDE